MGHIQAQALAAFLDSMEGIDARAVGALSNLTAWKVRVQIEDGSTFIFEYPDEALNHLYLSEAHQIFVDPYEPSFT